MVGTGDVAARAGRRTVRRGLIPRADNVGAARSMPRWFGVDQVVVGAGVVSVVVGAPVVAGVPEVGEAAGGVLGVVVVPVGEIVVGRVVVGSVVFSGVAFFGVVTTGTPPEGVVTTTRGGGRTHR